MGKALIVAWLIAEALAYVAVLSTSLTAAVLIGAGSTALGIVGLRLVGRRLNPQAALAVLKGESPGGIGSLPILAIGSALLLAPGFLSDVVGLAIVIYGVPSLLKAPLPRPQTQSVDLQPGEWTRLPDDDRRR